MKSLTAVCQQTAGGATSMPSINPSGRVSRPTHPHRGDGENAEMKMYLSKLKDLVPFMPKNRKLSKLEIIQHVIDYICDLQSELETHPQISNFDAATALNLNGVAQHLAAAAADGDSNNGNSSCHDDTDDRSRDGTLLDDNSRLSLELGSNNNHQQQSHLHHQSSPIVRQPLATRQSPNTILPPSHQLPHHQQALYSASHLISSNNGITNNQQHSDNETTDQQKQSANSSNNSRHQC